MIKMRRWQLIILALVLIVLACTTLLIIKKQSAFTNNQLAFIYPFNNALFPPEFPAPTFKWIDSTDKKATWHIKIETCNKKYTLELETQQAQWRPTSAQWDSLKLLSDYKKIKAKIWRVENNAKLSKDKGAVIFSISEDEVGAPVLYREIPLPFAFAEKYPDSMSFRLVNVGSDEPPHYSMRRFMVCGNCHSFSNNGKNIGVDFDAAKRDKGGYFIESIKDTIIFDTSNYLSWNKLQDRTTFGMFSKLSPDGRYVATTIKDRVVSEHFGFSPDVIPFSQIFFPVNGVIAIYDRVTNKIWELPGANLEEYVQSNAFWTPDGKNIVFSRAKALHYEGEEHGDIKVYDQKIIDEFVEGKRDFKFDVCIVPFNNGKGGEAKPVKGASNNGMSNFFPAVSPDGKWLVFCKAENFMLLQPDSKLYIVPLEGGKARKLKANLPLMNSWHAWSPNSKWIVYSSKGLSVYTDLFLTHIDEKGNASIPVLIEKVHVPGRAANYPEFVNVPADYKFTMIYNYVNLDHITVALAKGDTAFAEIMYREYLKQDQYSLPMELIYLGRYNVKMGRYEEAIGFLEKALEIEPGNVEAQTLLFMSKSRIKK